MNENIREKLEKQSAWARTVHSIRTRYALVTAVLLLLVLGMFYVGGRIVLVHFVRDAEGQVKDIGFNISRLINREGESTCRAAAALAHHYGAVHAAGRTLDLVRDLAATGDAEVLLAAYLSEKGEPRAVCLRLLPGCSPEKLATDELKPYGESLASWTRQGVGEAGVKGIGILRLREHAYYCALARASDGSFVLVGTAFDTTAFTARVNASLSGMEVRVLSTGRNAAPKHPRAASPEAPRRNAFGLVPMVTEALNFYTGGFWEFGKGPLEAAFTIRDVAGKPLTLVAISLPRTFSAVTASALGRLTFFIAVIGLLLILPVFWFQNYILLNPLSKMIARTKEIAERHNDIDCPRVEWEGDDEFAQLAVSLNMMLETLSRRALAVAQSEARQRALIAGVPDGLGVFDRTGRLVSIVKDPEDGVRVPGCVEGQPLDPRIWSEQNVQSFGSALAAVFETGRIGYLSLGVQGPEESASHYEARLTRVDDHFALAVVRDITRERAERQLRRRAEERLARVGKQESMALFAAGIAHDVNNILATVINTVEVSFLEQKDPFIRAAVDSIRDAVSRGSAMMRELQTYAGETKIVLKRMSPASIVANVHRLLDGVVSGKVPLVCDVPADLPDIDADPNQIWKVFFNLVKNAAEAMAQRPGHITLTARPYAMTAEASVEFHAGHALPPGAGVLFDVRDEGLGITAEMIKRIFDPYMSSKNVGRGLGLAIVAAIVDAHGGGISVDSVPDRGTVFHVYLPVSRLPPPESPAAKALSAPDATTGAAGDVLLVDDDAAVLVTSSILLKSLGYTVHAAKDNHEAMAVYRRLADKLKCVLLDAHLGKTDAVRLLSQFRNTDARVPVVVVSGSSRETVDELFAEWPFNAFLAKPYTRAELDAALAAVTTA